MKSLITAILLILILNVQGQTYYVNAVTGNDANTGLTTALAWKTLAKINATNLPTNAIVRFNRGDVFYGSLVPRGGNVTFDAYGTGAKPIISGFTTITSWQSSGNGIYSAIVANIDTTTFNLLSINGQPQAKARFPDVTAANQGYLSFKAGDTTKLWGVSTSPSRVGRDIVFKPNFWTLQKGRIWKQVLDTVWYRRIFDIGNGAAVGYSVPNAGYGYFFQNDSAYLTQFGEWHLDKITKRVRVYFGAANPASYSVRVSTVDTLVNLANRPNVVINNISLEGGNLYGFYSASNSGVTINTCDMNQFGAEAIGFNIVSNVIIDSSTIKNTLSTGIYIKSNAVNNVNITYNTLDSTGMIPGMGSYNQGSDYSCMSVSSNSGLVIAYNRASNAGLDIRWQGSNVDINGNYTDKFCQTGADHAGGFYTYDPNGATVYTNRVIRNNFVTSSNNKVGNVFGTSDTTREEVAGIYLDGTTNNVTLLNNTIWRIKGNGIQMNGPTNVTVRGNIILLDSTLTTGYAGYKSNALNYNSNTGAGSIPVGGGDTISNLNIKGNIAYVFKNTQRINYTVNRLSTGTSLATSMRSYGTLDSNYYNKTTTPIHGINYYNPAYNLTSYTMANWRILTLFDTHTTSLRDVIQDSVLLLTNWSNRDSTFTFVGKKYIDAYGNVYTNSTLLSPYTGRLLFYNGVSAATLIVSVSKTDVSCFGGSNGTATATPSGGLAPYTYLWTPSSLTTATITGRTANTYSVLVTDANGTTASGSAVIAQPTALVATAVATGTITVIGGTTSVVVSVTGGVPPYTGTGTFIAQGVGLHTYPITDANGCTTNATITLAYTSSGTFTATMSGTNVTCFGSSTGSATVVASGGVSPYTYLWSPGSQTTSTISSKTANTYSVLVTDGVGSTVSNSITITQPSALVGTATATGLITSIGGTTSVVVTASGGTLPYTGTGTFTSQAVGPHSYPITDGNGCTTNAVITLTYTSSGTLTATMSKTNVNCFGNSTGSATVVASGGVSPYTYLWTPGSQTTSTISSKAAGTYSVVVTDGVGSTVGNSITITQPTALAASSSSGVVTTPGGTTSVIITASGGTPPYTGTGTFTGQTAGSHTYNITDANSCPASTTIVVPYIPPSDLAVTLSKVDVSCFGGSNGSITSTVTGGTPPYTYSWSPGGQITSTRSSLTAGTYILTVTDVAAFVRKDTITLIEPPAIAVSHSFGIITNVGSTTTVLISATGGTPPYTGTGTYLGQGVGQHIYTVTDSKGCVKKDTIVLTYTSTGTLTTVLTATPPICFGGTGSITSANSGGVTPYTYSWSNGATTQNLSGVLANSYTLTLTDGVGTTTSKTISLSQPSAIIISHSFGTISSVGGTTTVVISASGGTPSYTGTGSYLSQGVGQHIYTVIDANGCIKKDTIVLGYTSSGTLTTILTATDAICYNGTGSITSSNSGGITPYTYLWSNGATTQNLSGVVAGTYTLLLTDGIGDTVSRSITLLQPTELVGSGTYSPAITVTGGTTTVTISAVGGTPTYIGTGTFNNVLVGTHNYPIEDANGCKDTVSLVIPLTPVTIGLSFSTSNATCAGGANGTINTTVTGGVPPFTYLWSNGATTKDLTGLSAGIYTLTVTDSVNTSATSVGVVIGQPTPVSVSALPGIIIFPTGTTNVLVSASGGTAPYTNTGIQTNQALGSHTYTVTDALGCQGTKTIIISLTIPEFALGIKYIQY